MPRETSKHDHFRREGNSEKTRYYERDIRRIRVEFSK